MTATPPDSEPRRRPAVAAVALPYAGQAGFSLVEALVSIAILSLVAIALAQTVGFGLASNQSADDMTQATVITADKLEELRASDYAQLVAGGALGEDSEGYSDALDINGDGTTDFIRRWQITDQPGGKLITVWASSALAVLGPGKTATMASVVAER